MYIRTVSIKQVFILVCSVFMQACYIFGGFVFSLLLPSGAVIGPDSRRGWRTCGSVQPPADQSLLQYSSNRVSLETSGMLQCNCRGDRAKSDDFENVKLLTEKGNV